MLFAVDMLFINTIIAEALCTEDAVTCSKAIVLTVCVKTEVPALGKLVDTIASVHLAIMDQTARTVGCLESAEYTLKVHISS